MPRHNPSVYSVHLRCSKNSARGRTKVIPDYAEEGGGGKMSNVVNKMILNDVRKIVGELLVTNNDPNTWRGIIEDRLEDMGYSEQDFLDNHLDIDKAIEGILIEIAKKP